MATIAVAEEHRLNGEYKVHGKTFKVQVSPCCWMYPGYGLQFEYTSKDGRSNGFIRDKLSDQATTKREYVHHLLFCRLNRGKCRTCKKTVFRTDNSADSRTDETPKDHRKGECVLCWRVRCDEEWKKIAEEEKEKDRKQDAKMRAKGFRWKVVAWVHPPRGDDYSLAVYGVSKPTDDEIRAVLKRRQSRRLDDFTITKL